MDGELGVGIGDWRRDGRSVSKLFGDRTGTHFPDCNIWKAKRFLDLSKCAGRREMEYGELGPGTGDLVEADVGGARERHSVAGTSEDHHDGAW